MESKYYIDIEDNIKIDYDPSRKDKRYNLTLGNLSTTGWYWTSDNADDLLGFFIRSINSDFEYDFLREISEKADFASFKKDLLKSASKGGGLYEISGDNGVWNFTSNLDYIDYEINEIVESRNLKLKTPLKDFIDKIYDLTDINYEDFERKYKQRYIKEVSDVISKSNDFNDLYGKLDFYEKSKINDYLKEFINNKIEIAIEKVLNGEK